MVTMKYAKLCSSLLIALMVFNVYSYLIGRIQLIPLLIIGSAQILLFGIITMIDDKLKQLEDNE